MKEAFSQFTDDFSDQPVFPPQWFRNCPICHHIWHVVAQWHGLRRVPRLSDPQARPHRTHRRLRGCAARGRREFQPQPHRFCPTVPSNHRSERGGQGRRQFGSIRKLPSGRWQARYRDHRGRYVAAPRTFPTKGDASKFLAAVQTDLDRRSFLNPEGSRITVSEWVDEWLGRPGKRPSSLYRDRQAFRVFLPVFGSMFLVDVSAHAVQAAVDARARVVAPGTVRRDFASLKAVFNAAVDLDLIERSPTRRIKLPATFPPEREAFGPADVAKLTQEIPPPYRALVLVAAVLGLRWGEAVALRVCDIDFAGATVTVAQTVEELAGHVRLVPYGKTRTSLRSMTVPRFILEALAAHLATHRPPDHDAEDLVFVGPKGAILRRNFVRRILQPAAERAGLPKSLTFHMLRHVALSSMAEAGLPYSVTQARAGHATARMTMEVYSHRSSAADHAAADMLESFFGDALRGLYPNTSNDSEVADRGALGPAGLEEAGGPARPFRDTNK